jgi:hypothetical protein
MIHDGPDGPKVRNVKVSRTPSRGESRRLIPTTDMKIGPPSTSGS